ncbi:MAG: hypothetical protein LBQ24_07895 [Candidatus Peribacteria bacterium]|nr:hypothetical protein [Candidatus Peribacteria bacterium]
MYSISTFSVVPVILSKLVQLPQKLNKKMSSSLNDVEELKTMSLLLSSSICAS